MTTIGVYADWQGLDEPRRLGLLHSRKSHAGELFEFEYCPTALVDPMVSAIQLDPRIAAYEGPQFPSQDQDNSACLRTPALTAGGGC